MPNPTPVQHLYRKAKLQSFHRLFSVFLTLIISIAAGNSFADYPRPWQIGFQEAVTPVMENISQFHNLLLIVIYAIGIFVFVLLLYTCIKFSAKNNPTPSQNTHNTLIEILWTVIPVIILVMLCIPSMRTLYMAEKVSDADMTIKVIGNQWYWSYQYPDQDNLAFDSYIIKDADLKPGQMRLLEVDNHIVVPIDTKIRVQITSADVIHSWAVPSFGVKLDAVPGKLQETWFKVTKIGTYYGQCSELCGVGHGFMPIAVDVVSKEDFAKWVLQAKKKFASNGNLGQVAAK